MKREGIKDDEKESCMALYIKAMKVQASWDLMLDLTCFHSTFVQCSSRFLVLNRMGVIVMLHETERTLE